MADEPRLEEVSTTREEVRPGLMMVKRVTLKEDGRRLVFYDFERAEAPGAARGGAAMTEITYHVHGIHCEACEKSIRSALSRVDGIDDVRVDIPHSRVTVRFDDGRTNVLAVKERIEKAGFDVG